MQHKKPFNKKWWFCVIVIFITFFTNFVSGNTGMQDAQQTVIAKSTKVVKSNAKKVVTEKVTVKRRRTTRKRKSVAKRKQKSGKVSPNVIYAKSI